MKIIEYSSGSFHVPFEEEDQHHFSYRIGDGPKSHVWDNTTETFETVKSDLVHEPVMCYEIQDLFMNSETGFRKRTFTITSGKGKAMHLDLHYHWTKELDGLKRRDLVLVEFTIKGATLKMVRGSIT